MGTKVSARESLIAIRAEVAVRAFEDGLEVKSVVLAE